MRHQLIQRIAGAMIIIALAGGLAMWNWWQGAIKPYAVSGNPEIFGLTPGMTAAGVAQELETRHIIRSAWAFRVLARSRQVDARLFPGEYSLSPAMTPQEIIDRLLKGPDAVRVTIPEGYTTEQIINVLVEKGLGKSEDFHKVVAADSFPYPFLKGAVSGAHRLEGFLFPDTYFFEKGSTPHGIIDTFLQRFNQELTPETQDLLKQNKLSVHDWVILSSMVEKEAEKEADRPLIASVFFNRLHINMPLQSCATIQFILGYPKPKLYNNDLKIASPYNTYLHQGLPPGPIANPGHASLQAVLHPAQTNYLYFVAKSDGYHVFAKTYEEHLQNQKKYEQ